MIGFSPADLGRPRLLPSDLSTAFFPTTTTATAAPFGAYPPDLEKPSAAPFFEPRTAVDRGRQGFFAGRGAPGVPPPRRSGFFLTAAVRTHGAPKNAGFLTNICMRVCSRSGAAVGVDAASEKGAPR